MKKQILIFLMIVLCSSTVFAIVGHPANQVFPGLFDSGDYSFDGNVGIGTDSPSSSLHLYGSGKSLKVENPTDNPGVIYISGNRTLAGNFISRIQFQWDGNRIAGIEGYGVNDAVNKDEGEIRFKTRGSGDASEQDRMTIDSAGNVGIGTSSPVAPLHVNHATLNTVAMFESGDTQVAIGLRDDSTTSTPYIAVKGNNISIGAGGASRITVVENGNVGIGTATPIAPLTVKGNLRVEDASGGGYIKGTGTTVSTSAVTIGRVSYGGLFVVSGGAGTPQFTDLVFYAYAKTPDVIYSRTVSGAPVVRTYTGSGYLLQLAMASGTYTVKAIQMGS